MHRDIAIGTHRATSNPLSFNSIQINSFTILAIFFVVAGIIHSYPGLLSTADGDDLSLHSHLRGHETSIESNQQQERSSNGKTYFKLLI